MSDPVGSRVSPAALAPQLSPQSLRITLYTRLFTLLALAAPVVWSRDDGGVLSLLAISAIWGNAVLHERDHWLRLIPVTPVAEAALIGVVCGASVATSPSILLALAVPPFVASIHNGLRAMLPALAAQLAAVLAISLLTLGALTTDEAFVTFTWLMAGLGLGLIGSFLHVSLQPDPADEMTPYVDAKKLLNQLIDLSDDLSSGLDVNSLGGSIMSVVLDQLPATDLALYVPHDSSLVPLVARTSQGDDLSTVETLALEAWARAETIVDERSFAFLVGEMAVISGQLAPSSTVGRQQVASSIQRMSGALRLAAVQLDTALLFSDFRDMATADIRLRLAREMHDGVAQDIASLGYLVDALSSRPADDKQAGQFTMLRERITKIVAEVRQSVLTLRTSVGEAESLGAAIGSVARHLSESSQIPIQITLDEHSIRLRSEVEAELFRITQEAMNNAIKHAHCSLIEVHCQVHAPHALITVTDNGRGMQQARADSQGLKIMRERAELVDADLSISENPTGGLVVAVRLPQGG